MVPHDSNPIRCSRLRVRLSSETGPWSVPIDYYHLLRAAVYHLLADASGDLANFLHADGFTADAPAVDWPGPRDWSGRLDATAGATERFKLFCYSSLIGQGSLSDGLLRFDEPVLWFFSTALGSVADALATALRRRGVMRIGRTSLKVVDLTPLAEPPPAATLTAVLLSPLVISTTIPADQPDQPHPEDSIDPAATGSRPSQPSTRGGRYYLTRQDGIVLTEARLRANLLAKHRALYGTEPPDPKFRFLWAGDSPSRPTPARPTRLVRLSRPGRSPIRVRGNLGAVTLAGTWELLRLALHTGLGQHNASGMGFLLPTAEEHLLEG